MGKIAEFLKVVHEDEKASWKEEMAGYSDAIAKAHDEMSKAKDDKSKEVIKAKIEKLQKSLDGMKKRYDAKFGESKNGDYNSTPNEIKKRIQDYKGEISDLKSKLAGANQEVKKRIQAHIGSLEDSIEFLNSELKSIANEELSQEIQDKIKANNDKMTDLKKNGGSQEEIDALEKENDELNGGKETSESQAREDFYNIIEKDDKKAKMQAEYKKHMDARSDAYQKFVTEKEKHGSSDKFYNEDPTKYNSMRAEIDKHAHEADKVWDKIKKMK